MATSNDTTLPPLPPMRVDQGSVGESCHACFMAEASTTRYQWNCATSWPTSEHTLQALTAGYREAWCSGDSFAYEGSQTRQLLEAARSAVATSCGIQPANVTFTTSAAVALRQIITMFSTHRRTRAPHLLYSAIEQASIFNAVERHTLSGGSATELGVTKNGLLQLDQLAQELRANSSACVVVQHSNAEIGVCQNLAAIHALCKEHHTPLVVDASAAAGYVPFGKDWDVLVAPASSWGGPIGTSITLTSPTTHFLVTPTTPLDQQLATPDCFAAAVALQHAQQAMAQQHHQATTVTQFLREHIPAKIDDVDIPGDPEQSLPHVLTASFLYCDGESLVRALDKSGFHVGSGSACTSSTLEPSHVLAACGRLTHGNVRIGLAPSPSNTITTAQQFLAALCDAVKHTRALLEAP